MLSLREKENEANGEIIRRWPEARQPADHRNTGWRIACSDRRIRQGHGEVEVGQSADSGPADPACKTHAGRDGGSHRRAGQIGRKGREQ